MEVRTKELRIGNIVNLIYPNRHKEHIITEFDIVDIAKGELIALPIPLTEQWFLALGFEIDDHGAHYISISKYEDLRYSPNTDEWLITGYDDVAVSIPHEPKYLHTLQNLFYALTGIELTLKDDGSKN